MRGERLNSNQEFGRWEGIQKQSIFQVLLMLHYITDKLDFWILKKGKKNVPPLQPVCIYLTGAQDMMHLCTGQSEKEGA